MNSKFQPLDSLELNLIPAQRRGQKVEEFYANLIGTITLKYAANPGAKNLIASAIATTQTAGPGGRPKDPTPGTLKADLVTILRNLESAKSESLLARDQTKTHEERSKLAHQTAEVFVSQFWNLRSSRREGNT